MEKIVILDCGGQYAHLIGNRIRRLQVYSEIKPNQTKASELKDYQGIIISGGPQAVYLDDSPQVDPAIFELGIPILGICYGHQLIIHTLKGKVGKSTGKEYGSTIIHKISDQTPLIFSELKHEEKVWMSHGDEVLQLPSDFTAIYNSKNCKIAAYANEKKHIYGIQFHAEVTHTPHGMTIFDNFLNICGIKRSWTLDNFLQEETDRIKQQVGDKKVFLLTSGGVDSSVAFLMLSKILGKDRVYGLFVDTGLMRKNERLEVKTSMTELGFANLHIAEKSNTFLEALKNKFEPEQKRQIIGDLFLDIQREYSNKLNLNPAEWLIGQGTIYPDTIESGGTKHAAKIKTHHNRVPQIEELIKQGLIIEPLKDLYKDEIRELGLKLGLPSELVWRHPFPGPGLGVRILCSDKPEIIPNATEIENKINQQFQILNKILPIKSVGVQGDSRTYRHPVSIFLNNQDINWENLEKVSTEITNQYPDINRVLLCLSHSKSPIEITTLNRDITADRVKVLQEIDAIVMKLMRKFKLLRHIWQFPVVLLPLSNDQNKESIVLRPVCSEEAMTANFTHLEPDFLHQLREEIIQTKLVSMLFFDLTNKPPGTIEWE